ncbi:F-box protein [Capsicum baccatum]|uniref:F-box protein n=1 Tax=Capsicum baccatum TaxID=33114 RepID=A0A2G2UVL2_CAPBA|nr:F-box protein [Capsicum baccatum]
MGKVSPKDGQSKTPKQKKRSKCIKSKYLRPGALAQLRNTKISAAKSSTDLWKKRVVVRNADDVKEEVVLPNDVKHDSTSNVSGIIAISDVSFPLAESLNFLLQLLDVSPKESP